MSAIERLRLSRGLLVRSLVITLAPLIVLQIVVGVIFFDWHWSNVSRHRANSLAGEILLVVDLMRERQPAEDVRRVADLVHRFYNMKVDVLPGAQLAGAAHAPKDRLERTLVNSFEGVLPAPFVIDGRSEPRRVTLLVQLSSETVLQIVFDSKRIISATTKAFIMWMVGSSVVLAAVAVLFMGNQVRPMLRLADAAESLGQGRDTPNLNPSGATEVRQATTAFCAMRDRIHRQMQQRTEMLAGVSHDLRTLLTRMKLQLTMLGDRPEIAAVEADVNEMDRTIEDFLRFARGEASARLTNPPSGVGQ